MINFRKRQSAQTAALVLGAALFGGGQAAASPDFVINDDLVVLGSTCTGFDCFNNMPFGFDTLVLRENNLRIFFDDTSTSAGFPANKWRLVANDSASGGASFFAIEDSTAARQVFKVTAGAPANALFVSSNGNVGLGTATPVLDLSINTSDTPAHRLEQNNSGGFTAQTWDIAGNEANFFVRDVTGGSRLPLRIRPGAPTSSLDIAANGFIGIGTASPLQVIHSKVSSGDSLWRMDTATKAAGVIKLFDASGDVGLSTNLLANVLYLRDTGNVGVGLTAPAAKLDVNGTVRAGTLNANPAANTMCFGATNILGNCTSDGRLKRDVEYLYGNAGLAAVMQLKPAAFRWHDGDDRVMAGFIAQDTEHAIPAAVHRPAGAEFLALDTGAVLAYAVKAIQELKADNDTLRAEIERLKAAR
jgi:endosialidase-like protein